MTNGEMIQKVFNCEVCEPIIEDDIIHVIFADKKDSAIGLFWSWWNAEYKEPKSEWEHDHEILKAYSDGADDALDKIRAEILEEMLSHSGTGEKVIQAYADGLKKGLEFIDKYKTESEEKK